MRIFTALLGGTVAVAGCAQVPPLEQASGTFETNILIQDVVKAVKCEIADAFREKLNDKNYFWLLDWTSKVDLTLQVNAQAGITPTGSFNKSYKNAFNFDAGSTSLTNPLQIPAVPQFFQLSIGANLSEQAQRTDVVSFSLSMKELKRWDETLASKTARPNECAVTGAGLTGGLGLKEWVSSALYPVDMADLQLGIHPPPSSAPSKPSSSPSGGGKAGAKDVTRKVSKAEATRRVQAALAQANANALDAQVAVKNMKSAVRRLRATLKKYYDAKKILDIGLKNSFDEYVNNFYLGLSFAAAEARDTIVFSEKIRDDVQPRIDKEEIDEAIVVMAEDYSAYVKEATTSIKARVKAAEKDLTALNKFKPDPPIDGLLHSVQFVVTYGANISPNWSFLAWKGPSISTPGVSASAIRTHTLNIALGTPGKEPERLIQNQAITSALGPRP